MVVSWVRTKINFGQIRSVIMCLRGSRAIKNMTFSLKILTFRNTFHNNKTILVAASDKADFNINFKSRDKKIYDFR